MKLEYKNPKKRQGIFIWEMDVNFLSREDIMGTFVSSNERVLEKLQQKYGKDAICYSSNARENTFFLWMAEIKEWETQKNISVDYGIEKKKAYEDKENGNFIAVFDFSSSITGKKQVRVNFTFDAYEVELTGKDFKTGEYDRYSTLFRKYTKFERQISPTDDIIKTAKDVTLEQGNYIGKAKRLYDWMVDNISHEDSNNKRNALRVFESKKGNSREISFLYISLLRSIDIPARIVAGVYGEEGRKQEFHSWAEFYLEGVGWVPVDCSKKLFSELDSNRIIFSKGESIVLERGPMSSNIFDINNKKAFFMQPEIFYIDCEKPGFFALNQNKYLLVKEQLPER